MKNVKVILNKSLNPEVPLSISPTEKLLRYEIIKILKL